MDTNLGDFVVEIFCPLNHFMTQIFPEFFLFFGIALQFFYVSLMLNFYAPFSSL